MDDELFDILKPDVSRDEDGRITAVYLKLRTGSAQKAYQPDEDQLTYVYLDKDGKPIGIKYHARPER